MPRHGLGELEQVILLALLRLGGESYGAAIRAEIHSTTGRSVTPGAIYPTLDRLQTRGLLASTFGEPTPQRGGRARRHFRFTPVGLAELRRSWRQSAALAAGVRALATEDGDA
jgi:DNA-binding PadR family transcriptional regulator